MTVFCSTVLTYGHKFGCRNTPTHDQSSAPAGHAFDAGPQPVDAVPAGPKPFNSFHAQKVFSEVPTAPQYRLFWVQNADGCNVLAAMVSSYIHFFWRKA